MYNTIVKHQAQDRVLVTSFHKTQIRRFVEYSNDEIAVGASQAEVAECFLKFNSMLGNTFTPQADTFQMPTEFKRCAVNV